MITTDVSARSIHLQWNPPSENDQNGLIVGYIAQYFITTTNSSMAIETNTTELLLDAQPYTNYRIRVAAFNAAGHSPFSEFTSVDTLQDGNI